MIAAYFGIGEKTENKKAEVNEKSNDDLLEFLMANEIKKAPYNGPRMI